MLKKFTQTLRIDITPQALRLLRVSRWGSAAPEVLAEQALDGDMAEALEALLAGHELSGWPVCIVLADELVRLWQVAPPAQASRLADLEGAAALRFNVLYGDSPAAWEISAGWSTTQPFLAAAVPRALKAQLEQVCAARGLTVAAICPHFVAAWNRHAGAIRQGAWFGVVQDKVLALAAIEGGQLKAVRHLPIPHGADHYWLTQMAQREALVLDLQAPTLIQLCGELPAALAKPAASDTQIATAPLGVAA